MDILERCQAWTTRTKGLSEELSADASAVSAGSPTIVGHRGCRCAFRFSRFSGWSEIEGDLLDDRRVCVPAFPLEVAAAALALTGRAMRRGVPYAPVDYVAQAVLAAIVGVCGPRVFLSIAPGFGRSPCCCGWLWSARPRQARRRRFCRFVACWPCSKKAEPIDGGDARSDRSSCARGQVWKDGCNADRNPRGMLLWRDGAAGCLAPLGGGRSVRDLDPYAVEHPGLDGARLP